jgi:hypothetical protein
MDIRGGAFNTTIMRRIANKYGHDPGGSGSLHVERGVTQVPHRAAGRSAEVS